MYGSSRSRYQRTSLAHWLCPGSPQCRFNGPMGPSLRCGVSFWIWSRRSHSGISATLPDKSCGLNGWTQHFLAVYSRESENLKCVVGVDLSAALLGSDPTESSRLGLFSSGSIVVRARLCFRSSRVARGSADHRSRLSHPWLP